MRRDQILHLHAANRCHLVHIPALTSRSVWPTGRPINVVASVLDTEVAVDVSDEGVGFAIEEAPLVFDRFYRAVGEDARIAGTGLVIPIAVSGPIRDPMVKVNDLRAAEANAGTVAEAVIGNATPLGIVGGLLGGDKLFNPGTTDICGPALAAARGQPVPEAARTEKSGIPNPAALLKNLFR